VTGYIKFCEEMCIETKSIKVFPNNKPWVTKELKSVINERNRAYKNNDRQGLNVARKKLRSTIIKAKISYKEKMEKNLKDMNAQEAWRMIRTMGGVEQKTDKKSTTLPKVEADQLNDFYCRFDKPVSGDNALTAYEENTPEIECETVTQLFQKLKTSKSPGPDGITAQVLKECCSELSEVFTILFQRSIDEASIPPIWKTSTMVPVPKKQNPTQLNDLRPVALTSIPMKCLERILKCHLINEIQPILDPLQFAYQHAKGVEDALLTTIDTITSHLDSHHKNYARLLFVDFSSAFNAMDADILIHKLHAMGVSKFLINWYQDFLTKRPQQVKYKDALSTVKHLSNGCPQGCVSSPILYIAYTNDCKTHTEDCVIIKFADDTTILGLMTPENETAYFEEIGKFTLWCEENKLSLNIKKTKEEIFDFRKSNSNHMPIVINNETVEVVTEYKYLGINVDDQLKFKSHTDHVCKKISQRLRILRQLRKFEVSRKTMKLVYNSLVKSIMTFGLVAWYGCLGTKEKAKIQSIMKTAGKTAYNIKESVSKIFEERVVDKTIKIITNKKHPLNTKYQLLPSGRRYKQMKIRTNRYKTTFIPQSITLYNKL